MVKKRLIFNIIVSAALLLFLMFRIDLQEMLLLIQGGNRMYFLLAFLILPVMFAIRAKKWKVLLDCIKIERNIFKITKILLIGIFYGMLSPAKIGELGRVYFLKESKAKTIPTVIVDKFIDILLLVILSIIAIPVFFKNVIFIIIAIGIGIGLFVAAFFVTNKKVIEILGRLFKVSHVDRNEYRKNMLFLFRNKSALVKSFFYGILFYAAVLILAAVILVSLKETIDLRIVWLVPVIILFGNAPITISGLGLREYIAVLSFELFGEPGFLAFSYSIIHFSYTVLLPGIVGYFINLINKEKV